MKKVLVFFMLFVAIAFAQTSKVYQFVSPLPGSELNAQESTIILTEGTIINPSSLQNGLVNVRGSVSGEVSGELILSTDRKTVIFKPDHKFAANEKVFVSVNEGLRTITGKTIPAYEFNFSVTPLSKEERTDSQASEYREDGIMKTNPVNFAQSDTLPSDFPPIRTEVLGETGEGYVFATVSRQVEGIGYYIMMLNNDGTPFYYKKIPHDYNYNFRMQPNGYLSYSEFLSHHSFTGGGNVIHKIMDNSFTVVDSFQAGNGYIAEAHGFQLLPNGHALLFCYDLLPMDLEEYGGHPNARVAQTVVQELDQDKNVVFQWRSYDHYPKEAIYSFGRIGQQSFDPIHINSIILDTDENIIVTSNGLSEATKINRQTGEIIWSFGGEYNDFEYIGDGAEMESGLHCISRLENGNILLFDNSSRGSNRGARAVEYDLDEVNMTATMVWQFVPDPPIDGFRRGSAQRLPNGNTIIGWGSASDNDSIFATEVNADGEEVLKMYFEMEGMSSYRVYRFPFTEGAPAAEVSQFEVFAGNTYTFEEGDENTGIEIKVNTLDGEGYNEIIAKQYNYAPINPTFFGKAPIVMPKKVIMSEYGINTITADVKFDVDFFGIENPGDVIIYHREFPDDGLFLPLSTTYNQVTGQIVAETPSVGEFIIAKPDLESMVFSPKLLFPEDGSIENQNLSAMLRWTPVGYVQEYALQVATDGEFSNIVVDEEYLTEAEYNFESLEENTTYFWKVKSTNDAGTSEWSEIFSFSSSAPYIEVTSPNGGEQFQVGLEYFIKWNDNIQEDVDIYLSPASALNWQYLSTVESTGGFAWEVSSDLEPGEYLISIYSTADTNIYAQSESSFSVIDTVTAVEDEYLTVDDYQLHQNFPNPFNPSTMIQYELKSASMVTLRVYSSLGEMVAELENGVKPAGRYSAHFDATDLTSGIYFYRISAQSTDGKDIFMETKKMIFIK